MKDKNMLVVGLVMKSLQADFFKVMQRGAEAFAAAHDRVDLISVGTDSQTEVEAQIALVDRMADDGVDAIVVVPIDSKALVAPVVRAVKRGITVVNIDIRLDEEMLRAEGVSLTYVGPDNFSASYALAVRLSSCLHAGDRVLMIEGLLVAGNARQRKAGFEKAISEAGLVLVASEPADWETAKAADVFRRLYSEHKDIKAVYCCNDAMALGVIDVLRECGKLPGEIQVIGFDNDEVMRPLIEQGWLFGTVDAFGPQMAVEGIKRVLEIADGSPQGGVYATPYEIIGGR